MSPSSLLNLPPELVRRIGDEAPYPGPQALPGERAWAVGVFVVVIATIVLCVVL